MRLGLLGGSIVDAPDDAATAAALYRAACEFVDAGGRVTLSEWSALTAAEREALGRAWRRPTDPESVPPWPHDPEADAALRRLQALHQARARGEAQEPEDAALAAAAARAAARAAVRLTGGGQ